MRRVKLPRRLAGVTAAAVALAAGLLLVRHAVDTTDAECTVVSDTRTFTLTPEQALNAATISGVAYHLGMPAHAVTVALATALQESKLQNLDSGDRDSAGLFQQRPSQGWGTHAQVTDPAYASAAFFSALQREPGWQTAAVTEAAQEVQHSAAPDAYAQWEPEARALAIALTGEAPAAFTCTGASVSPAPPGVLSETAVRELGTDALSGQHPPAVGWTLASWLVGHATSTGVDRVSFDGRTWTAKSGRWQPGGPTDLTLDYAQL